MKILTATNNPNKVLEIQNILEANSLNNIELIRPLSLGIESDPEESSDSLEGNSLIKADALYKLTNIPCIADDTGLFVREIDGKPGVRSARFASETANDSDNREYLLKLLENSTDRDAYFETVICYKSENKELYFHGRCEGTITDSEIGTNGFGYDSIFIPKGYNQTFAELDPLIKNSISHRYRAVIEFVDWIRNKN